MSRLRPYAVCTALAALTLLTSVRPVYSTQDGGMLGDLLILPGERMGAITLGISRQEVINRYGRPGGTGVRLTADAFPMRWDWPKRNLGMLEPWFDHAVDLAFCTSNQRAFLAAGAFVANFVLNAGVNNFRVSRLRTPEGLTLERIPYEAFVRIYGEPVVAAPRWGNLQSPVVVFPQGLLVVKPQRDSDRPYGIGAINPEICEASDARVTGTYVPFLGRVLSATVKVSKVGDLPSRTVGDEAREFRSSEPVFILLTLNFLPPQREAGLLVTQKLSNPLGQVLYVDKRYQVSPDQTSISDVWLIGAPRPNPGKSTVEFLANKIAIATTEFVTSP